MVAEMKMLASCIHEAEVLLTHSADALTATTFHRDRPFIAGLVSDWSAISPMRIYRQGHSRVWVFHDFF
jgi:hypothetical protein